MRYCGKGEISPLHFIKKWLNRETKLDSIIELVGPIRAACTMARIKSKHWEQYKASVGKREGRQEADFLQKQPDLLGFLEKHGNIRILDKDELRHRDLKHLPEDGQKSKGKVKVKSTKSQCKQCILIQKKLDAHKSSYDYQMAMRHQHLIPKLREELKKKEAYPGPKLHFEFHPGRGTRQEQLANHAKREASMQQRQLSLLDFIQKKRQIATKISDKMEEKRDTGPAQSNLTSAVQKRGFVLNHEAKTYEPGGLAKRLASQYALQHMLDEHDKYRVRAEQNKRDYGINRPFFSC